MEKYPEVATERFDKANFHINYCLSFFKKFMKGNILGFRLWKFYKVLS